jgi:hypothetical protein
MKTPTSEANAQEGALTIERYEPIELEVIEFDTEDIITESTNQIQLPVIDTVEE